jgi:bifunctional polynucleotide phosphatase/kinase
MQFEKYDSIYYYFNVKDRIDKIAAFDIDFTIIKPKSGKKFAKDAYDWIFLNENVPNILHKLYNDGYTIVFFTNQMGVTKGKTTLEELTIKFNAIINELNIKVDILIATDDDYYRKPHTGMWDFYKSKFDYTYNNLSFYCGDAAGRKYIKGKDFSSSDKYFAYNINLQFKLPEQVFNLPIVKYTIIDPYDNLDLDGLQNELVIEEFTFNDKKEMIILVGKPTSGKSTFCIKYYPSYTIINMNTLKTKSKCIKTTNEAIKNKHNVIIDYTNLNKKIRKIFIDIAKKYNMNIKIYVFDMSTELCKHLNAYRVQQTKGVIKKIPSLMYNIYNKNYQEPNMMEFNDISNEYKIIKLNFNPEFNNEEEKRNYYYKYDIK